MCKGNCACKADNVKTKAPCGEWENCDGCNIMDNPIMRLGQVAVVIICSLIVVSIFIL